MAAEATKGEIEELSGRIQGCARDFLRRFGGNSRHDEPPVMVVAGEEVEEIELRLGLSLGGRFGVEPKEKKKLVRSSSIATLSMFPLEHDFPVAAALPRACSLPTEAEEEHRKRKELQRLEVKRKRSERRNLSKLAARDQREENPNEGMNAGHGRVLPGSALTAAGASRCFRSASQRSIGSQGSSSSGVSNFESQMVQGSNGRAEFRSHPPTTPSLPEHSNHEAANSAEEVEESSKKMAGRSTWMRREMKWSMREEMPCVSATGDGPNGRRIEGFLYRYGEGEEVRIVCACHGSLLTPAEFVRHAGGGNVTHPLRHIVVNPTPSAFL